jgi:hypothetical protein
METETKAKVKGVLDNLASALREAQERKTMEEMRNNDYWLQEVSIRETALEAALTLFDPELHHDRTTAKVLESARLFETFLIGEEEVTETE